MKLNQIVLAAIAILSLVASIFFSTISHRDSDAALEIARDSAAAAKASAQSAERSSDEAVTANRLAAESNKISQSNLVLASSQVDADRPRIEIVACDANVRTIQREAVELITTFDSNPRQGIWKGGSDDVGTSVYRCAIRNVGRRAAYKISIEFQYFWNYYQNEKPQVGPKQLTYLYFSSIPPDSKLVPFYIANIDHKRPLLIRATGQCSFVDIKPASKCEMLSYPGKFRTIHKGANIAFQRDQ